MTYAATKFEFGTPNVLGGDTFTRKYILTFDLDLRVKVTRNVAQYHLHHVTYLATKFEVTTSNGLEGDTFTRNVMHGRTYRRTTDRLWYEINIPFFSKEKSGYNKG